MIFPFEREAEHGDPMPDGLDLADQCAYQFLRYLYRDLKAGAIIQEQAIHDKGKMTYEHSIAKQTLKNFSDLGSRWASIIKAVEGAQIKYRKNPTKENADALSAALDGRL